MTRTTARLVRLAGGLMAGAIVLAGCSNDGEGSSTGSSSESSAAADTSADDATAHNDADVAFVQGMLPHHEGALRMAQLADGRAYDPRVIDLANRIEAAQGPEIETMTGWLEEWGEPLPEEDMGGMDHGSGGMDMEGMTEEDMTALDSTSGAEFDRMFLEMMIPHHQGAVDMAETEIADGSNPDAVDMAREIVESQTAEIEEMQTLLTELGG
ncbi:DUF305 domain-containing protein [Candidatus Blastococcus massiliensis]|jgi:uncharacterized protein (DUF305 family)|uniref:DUF305 domain-containing protein n=1 Tax=Candidatus Blastococcus massiliensis TaxID=1470358 RepID=UPI0004B36338|nr:DUF305 domain-containing protein [Candidatus Blastococcus massiliensis]